MSEKREDRQNLLQGALRGEQASLELLMLDYCPDLERRLKTRIPLEMRSLIGVEDVLQETFTEVFRRIHTFEGPRRKHSGAGSP